ncbi:hypothetical protein ACFQ61_30310 [Streptomyces sp. NPDC056500]
MTGITNNSSNRVTSWRQVAVGGVMVISLSTPSPTWNNPGGV